MKMAWQLKSKSKPRDYASLLKERGYEPKSDFNKLKHRLNPTLRSYERFMTGLEPFDKLTQGLPYGFTVFMGEAGSGKSTLARLIAQRCNSLYICCEVLTDAPDYKKFKNVTVADYTNPAYIPNYKKAIDDLFCLIINLKPDLVVIDSITSFFSVSKMALPESALREAAGIVHQLSEGIIPIIGISEVRGTGFHQAPAGGKGIEHACSMLIEFSFVPIDYESQSKKYSKPIGSEVRTIRVRKDKHGLANTKEHISVLKGDDSIEFIPI